MDNFDFLFSNYNSSSIAVLWISLILFFVIGMLASYAIKDSKLVLTNKRVYGNAMFGRRVDIPLDLISKVSSGSMGITVSSSSGRINFLGIINSEEIHKSISELLVKRQDTFIPKATIHNASNNNAEALLKYKELLDMGVITQEEFDAKKKQLLEL